MEKKQVPKKNKSVTIFTSPTCVWCNKAKSYFAKKNIHFRAVDVTKDKFAHEDCLKHGCKGVPVIVIGGTHWICGFDEKKIENALGKI
jgi:glutaredoxin-like YruB-family protein